MKTRLSQYRTIKITKAVDSSFSCTFTEFQQLFFSNASVVDIRSFCVAHGLTVTFLKTGPKGAPRIPQTSEPLVIS